MKHGCSDDGSLRVAMLAPNREQCGISDYSRSLIAALSDLSSVSLVRCLAPPDSTAAQSHLSAVSSRSSRARPFREIGNSLGLPPAQLVHVQHEYSLFGGVAPHRNLAAILYSSVTLPIVLTVHEIVDERGGAVRRAAIRHINRTNFLHPAIRAWIVHTEADVERLANVGVNRDSIHKIQVGVPNLHRHVEKGEAQARLGLIGKRVVTLFGFLSAKKGHRDAFDAISTMPSDIVLVFAGDKHPDDRTDYAAALKGEMEVRNRMMPNRVRISGFLQQEDLQDVLAATDVAIAPYHVSSGSASVARLLAAGIPVIASDIPAFREIETEMPGTLALVPPHRPDLLAAELLRVMGSAAAIQDLRASAVRYAASHSYRTMAEATVKVYMLALG